MTPSRSFLAVTTALAMTWILPAFAQDPEGRKYALLIGIKRYDSDQFPDLRFTENDVRDLGRVLELSSYRSMLMTQARALETEDRRYLPTAGNIRRELGLFLAGKNKNDTVLIALAGHGVSFKKEEKPYFCPMDADLKDPRSLIALTDVYEALKECRAGVKLVLVDACRNEVFRALPEVELESVTRPQGLQPPNGTVVLFSCMAGQKALECPELGHGLFFHFLIEGLRGQAANKKGVVTLKALEKYLEDHVYDYAREKYRHRQEFSSRGEVEGAVSVVQFPKELVNSIGTRLVRLEAGRFVMGSPLGEQGRSSDEAAHEVEITRAFYMGKHEVTRGEFRKFVAATGYLTDAERDGKGGLGYNGLTRKWQTSLDYHWRSTGFEQTDDHPVVLVSWNDARAFCDWLTKKEGRLYRLPTEAEWEYGCRAGTTTRFHSGDHDATLREVANLADRSHRLMLPEITRVLEWDDGCPFTAPVGRFQPNAFGLHDLHGNVCEWCADWYDAEYYGTSPRQDPTGPATGKHRVARGGSFCFAPVGCRAANRSERYSADRTTSTRWDCFGFRVVCVP